MFHWYLEVSKAKYRALIFINILILLTFTALSYCIYSLFVYKNPNAIVIYFPYGTPSKVIANNLKNSHIIYDGKVFLVATWVIKKSGKNLISGEYQFDEGINTYEILLKLINGHRVLRKLTIPEGLTIKNVISQINNSYGLTGQISEEWFECNILPETYSYHLGDSKNSIVKAMKLALKDFMLEIMLKTKLNDFKDGQQIITLASIIEKETKIDDERSIVAGVYLNRLRIGMPLQADPTVIYGMSDGLGIIDHPLTRNDLKVDSPYNTYTRKGLPPTPIACPGKLSIHAAANPEIHDYLYFVADNNGGHIFAKTLKEHNVNNANRKQADKKIKNIIGKKT